jgi:hypothetical protein
MATVSFRRRNSDVADERAWTDASADLLRTAVPWRTFRWYKGQQHYSGAYWSATTRDHVIYESRLELARLLFADFDPSVRHIVAQPFLMKATVDGKVRKHVPDFLLVTDQGPVVVDVKPLHRVAKAEVAFTFDWVRQVVEPRGWRFEVWSEPPSVELENISVSWRAIAGAGSSTLSFWRTSAALASTGFHWVRSLRFFRIVRSRRSGQQFVTCSGSAAWLRI